jgi:hypothetical protein
MEKRCLRLTWKPLKNLRAHKKIKYRPLPNPPISAHATLNTSLNKGQNNEAPRAACGLRTELSQELGAYEKGSTAFLNAQLIPITRQFVKSIIAD